MDLENGIGIFNESKMEFGSYDAVARKRLLPFESDYDETNHVGLKRRRKSILITRNDCLNFDDDDKADGNEETPFQRSPEGKPSQKPLPNHRVSFVPPQNVKINSNKKAFSKKLDNFINISNGTSKEKKLGEDLCLEKVSKTHNNLSEKMENGHAQIDENNDSDATEISITTAVLDKNNGNVVFVASDESKTNNLVTNENLVETVKGNVTGFSHLKVISTEKLEFDNEISEDVKLRKPNEESTISGAEIITLDEPADKPESDDVERDKIEGSAADSFEMGTEPGMVGVEESEINANEVKSHENVLENNSNNIDKLNFSHNSLLQVSKDKVRIPNGKVTISQVKNDKQKIEIHTKELPDSNKIIPNSADLKMELVSAETDTLKGGRGVDVMIMNKEIDSVTKLNILRKFKGSLNNISKADLEQLIVQKMIEALLLKSQAATNAQKIMRQRQTFEELRKQIENVNSKFGALKNLYGTVRERISGHNNKYGCLVEPLKSHRSVGIRTNAVNFINCRKCNMSNLVQNSYIDVEDTKKETNKPLYSDPTPHTNASQPKAMQKSQKKPLQAILPLDPNISSTATSQANLPKQQQRQPLAHTPSQMATPKYVAKKTAPTLAPPPATNLALKKPAPAVAAPKAGNNTSSEFVDLTEDEKVGPTPTKLSMTPGGGQVTIIPQPFLPNSISVGVSSPVNTDSNGMTQNQASRQLQPPNPTRVAMMPIGNSSSISVRRDLLKHPAPLPASLITQQNPAGRFSKLPPPMPNVRVRRNDKGIVLSWTMELFVGSLHSEVKEYQLYGYQADNKPPSVSNWKSMGIVKPLKLPMAVTLTQFQPGQRYFFSARARDIHDRYGQFSEPATWI